MLIQTGLRISKSIFGAQRNLRCASTYTSSLAGSKCIITGASRGIGRAIAERFSAEGAACILVSRNAEVLNELVQQLPAPSNQDEGHVHSVREGDIAKREFWEGLAKEIVSRWM